MKLILIFIIPLCLSIFSYVLYQKKRGDYIYLFVLSMALLGGAIIFIGGNIGAGLAKNNGSVQKYCYNVDILIPKESDEIILDKNSKVKIKYKKGNPCLIEIIN